MFQRKSQKQLQSYTLPTLDNDYIANIGFFLLQNTGSIWGKWEGKIRVQDQRKLFCGRSFGRKTIMLDGEESIMAVWRTVNFGNDIDYQSLPIKQIDDFNNELFDKGSISS
ncbi:MAG: hypothetical protein GWN31_05290 [Candidatus Thorarchaeota archaeon]|nr:hypothetical protein [Candidatus Thorarchaeota archaeon]NIW13342.1 hypothetical protein [Candidatus Thorarchaeota archaeon]NIW51444.1 hypothetical protein [Candidatus Korarchaeota archaeon]